MLELFYSSLDPVQGHTVDPSEPPAGNPPDDHVPTANPISVLLVDDHRVIRVAIERALTAAGMRVVGQAETGAEAVELARRARPDVILMDVRMPDMDGLTATELIKQETPETALVIYTGFADPSYMRRAIVAGAAGFLLKGSSLADLVSALSGLVDGASLVDAGMLQDALREVRPETSPETPVEAPDRVALTPREQQCLRLLAEGWSNREIAVEMHYSTGSIKNLVRRIMDKTGVSDRTQAAVVAVKTGLI